MKLINSFLTCTGYIGRQWMIERDPSRTVTVWQDGKGMHMSAMKDADGKMCGVEAKRRYISLQGGHKAN